MAQDGDEYERGRKLREWKRYQKEQQAEREQQNEAAVAAWKGTGEGKSKPEKREGQRVTTFTAFWHKKSGICMFLQFMYFSYHISFVLSYICFQVISLSGSLNNNGEDVDVKIN